MLIQQMGNHAITAYLAAILASEAARRLHDLLWEIPLKIASFVSSAAQASYYDYLDAAHSIEAQEIEVDAEDLPFAAREDRLWASDAYCRAMNIVCGELHWRIRSDACRLLMPCWDWEILRCLVSQWLLQLLGHCLLRKRVPCNVL